MARLTFPTRPELASRLAARPAGEDLTLDAYASARVQPDGSIGVTLIADGTLTLTYGTEPLAHWTAQYDDASPAGSAVTLPEALVARANRLMLPDGVALQRDWRTKTHALRAAARRVLPILNGEPVTAAHTATGWTALAVASISEAGGLIPGPVAPASAAPTAAPVPALSDEDRDALEAHPALSVLKSADYEGDVILPVETRAKWQAARAAHRNGERMVIAMVGPSGQAKTHAAHALAAEEGLDLVRFDASGVTDPEGWFGTVVLADGRTVMAPSDLLVAVTLPGARVLLIDEMNRSALRALNALLPVLEGAKAVTIPQTGKRREVNRSVQIVVTANIGSSFLGTEPLDEAVRNRIGCWLLLDYLTEDENRALILNRYAGRPLPAAMVRTDTSRLFTVREPVAVTEYEADNLARLGDRLLTASASGAHPAASSRQLLFAACLTAHGLDARLAAEAAIWDGYDREGGDHSQHSKVKPHFTGIVWAEPAPVVQPDPTDPGGAGSVYTGTGAGCINCQHDEGAHGIGTDISASTHCRVCANVYSPDDACKQYSPAVAPMGAPR